MARRRLLSAVIAAAVSLAPVGVGRDVGRGLPRLDGCSPGAHTLAPAGSHVYPETGNGGYTSVHTDMHMVYDATTNMFLPGNNVALTDRATQCLTSFSLDFERQSPNTSDGPDDDGRLRHRERPRRPRSRSCSRPTPVTRTARTTPIRWRTRRRRTTQSAAPAATRCRLRARRNCRTRTPRGLAGRHPVPGEQAGHHPVGPDQGRLGVHRRGELHGPAGRAQRRRRHDRGLVPRHAAEASSRPSRSAPKTGCR